MYEIDERIVLNQFFESLRQHNITPRDEFSPIMDGQIHRFALEGDRYGKKTGAYIIYPLTNHDWPVWCIQDFRQDSDMITCKLDKDLISQDNRRSHMSYEEIQRRKAESERKELERQALQKENERIAIDEAFALWHSENIKQVSQIVNQHPYMLKKQVILPPNTNCSAGVDQHGNLIFPLFDSISGHFKSLQFISPPDNQGHSSKWFYKGISTAGIWFPIRFFKGDTLFICEGIATAFSLDEFTHRKYSVVAAMNCGNLLNVAKNCRKKLNEAKRLNPNLPNQKIIIAADNDKSNAGKNAADKVIKAGFADGLTMPEIEGYDWNDYLTARKNQKE